MKYKRFKALVAAIAIGVGVVSSATGGSAAAAEPSAAGPELTVNALQGRHAISPDIYGANIVNWDQELTNSLYQLGSETKMPVFRWGGNNTSLYNWLEDSSNSGYDYFYMGGSGNPDPVPSGSVDAMVDASHGHGGKGLVTVPITGYVNKTSEMNCSYPESLYPEQGLLWGQYEFNPYQTEANGDRCGSGLDPDYSPSDWPLHQLTNTTLDHNYIRVTPEWMEEWIGHLTEKYGPTSQSGMIYQMDNEPESWEFIHHDIHPDKTGFDELLGQTIDYASMIKRKDPSAQVLGPSNWGLPAYYDMEKDGDNWASHGMPWSQYYLTNLKAYEEANGVRLLDYFDQHFYPSVDGVNLANTTAGDEQTKKARLRSTRALWDPTYKQENWMGQFFEPAKESMIIPRMKSWVDQYYPGTKTAITEYNWGGLEDINGALAQADVLGIFGREGLDLATLWGPPKMTDPGAYAFRMYLNYDGKGSKYGDTWVESSSGDQDKLAVYGAQRSTDDAVTLMVINKTDSDLTSSLTLKGYMPSKQTAQVYSYSSADLNAIVNVPGGAAIGKIEGRGVPEHEIVYTYPANSITLLVVPGHDIPGAAHESASGEPGTGIQQGTVPPADNGRVFSPEFGTPAFPGRVSKAARP
ncbi:hypothetical protein FHS19_003110 [Paenibacillus rhizosphaerae]|uniref:Glycoside hydrolase family 44 catalytic domain-containing protein n=1 Tax=Paenibacillus rhizosphaerae TaxID=297318 RepID=A0A839TNS9_9BACL|nr:glycoside hydrolase family 44 protein [Paenibacillus rhizosphaerae]MBB3128456.1 hypothetical protein [Paenibacillus rhizosphaerae]